jgi:hypothetical protein
MFCGINDEDSGKAHQKAWPVRIINCNKTTMFQDKDCEKILSLISTPQPQAPLFDKVIARIKMEQRVRAAKRQAAIFSLGTIFSAAAFVFAFQSAKTAFTESGFVYFFSLLFSDFSAMASYWQSFVFSLLGSLPITDLLMLLAIALAFIASAKYLMKDVKIIISSNKLANN